MSSNFQALFSVADNVYMMNKNMRKTLIWTTNLLISPNPEITARRKKHPKKKVSEKYTLFNIPNKKIMNIYICNSN